jgi:hypothetical protein
MGFTHQVQCHFIPSCRVHAVDLTSHCWFDLDHLAQTVFIRFLHCKVTFLYSLFPYCIFWKHVTMQSPHSRELGCTTLRMEYLHKLFRILLHRRFVFSCLFMLSFIYIGSEPWILFYTLDYNPMLGSRYLIFSNYILWISFVAL